MPVNSTERITIEILRILVQHFIVISFIKGGFGGRHFLAERTYPTNVEVLDSEAGHSYASRGWQESELRIAVLGRGKDSDKASASGGHQGGSRNPVGVARRLLHLE